MFTERLNKQNTRSPGLGLRCFLDYWIRLFSVFKDKYFFNLFVEYSGEADCQRQARGVTPLFDRYDSLPGDSCFFS